MTTGKTEQKIIKYLKKLSEGGHNANEIDHVILSLAEHIKYKNGYENLPIYFG